ncbi:hypothetical protein [Acetobacterium wieringae]|uniref:hypothetical protein n=1 Tax=Acetobacterium wieringae TaxID=52694 RepID=UPI0026EA1429|nr:hypothetical protein [Acetobacterium wieringae]
MDSNVAVPGDVYNQMADLRKQLDQKELKTVLFTDALKNNSGKYNEKIRSMGVIAN